MLIKALSDYYDILEASGKVLPAGYSKVKIHYIVSLTEDGEMDDVLDRQITEEIPTGKGKIKQIKHPQEFQMPQRTEKPGIDANIIEHRPLYLFGLNMVEDELTPDDRTGKARKSHEVFVNANLEFLEGLDTPVVNAFRCFMQNWKPEMQTENKFLKDLKKNYGKSGFAFCLSGSPDKMLHDDPQVKRKWEERLQETVADGQRLETAQCAISGERAPIARIHNKIKGVYGGLATGSVLIGFNNASENSYGNEQSYNSNVSELVMKKYTEALNYLLASDKHKITLDELTIVFWVMNSKESDENLFKMLLLGPSEQLDVSKTETMLQELWKDASRAKLSEGRLLSLEQIDPNVDFYMIGLKPNSSRLAIKFIIQKQYADILYNIARFQKELQISREVQTISLPRIKMELISPKSKNEKANPALITKLFEAVLYGTPYPTALLDTLVRRAKTDEGRINAVRAGVLKACINRNYPKEELKVALDKENRNQAYLCGRLFAVLEKIQQDASGGNLNRTIKDSYFASACAKPTQVFPKLLVLSQNHLNKAKYQVFYNQLLGEIMDKLEGEFPDTLSLKEQGKFIVGYYQQNLKLWEKHSDEKQVDAGNKGENS